MFDDKLTNLVSKLIFKKIQQRTSEIGIKLRMPNYQRNNNLKSKNQGALFKYQNNTSEPSYRDQVVSFNKEDSKFSIRHKVLNKKYILVPEQPRKVRIMAIDGVSVFLFTYQ